MSASHDVITYQTGGRRFEGNNFVKYSGFLGGNNSTHHSLQQFSPQVNGFGRLFMVRQPYVVARYFGGGEDNMYSPTSEFTQFKHALEYYLAGFNGMGELQIENTGQALQGGYAGRSIQIPSVTKETTETFTTRLYEFNGSLIANVVKTWMSLISDPNSGLATYGGMISGGTNSSGNHRRLYRVGECGIDGVPYNEAEHTAEFIYVLTDRSGAQVESAWLLADCFPKSIPQAIASDMTPGTHDVVTYDIPWNCNVYQSPIITKIADDLLKQYLVVSNVFNFNPQLGDAVYSTTDKSGGVNGWKISKALGPVPTDAASGSQLGNAPVFYSDNVPKVRQVELVNIDGTANKDGDIEDAPKYNNGTGAMRNYIGIDFKKDEKDKTKDADAIVGSFNWVDETKLGK